MTPGIRCCIERRRQPTKATGQRARQIMDAVSNNYATTRRDRYICLTPISNPKCFLGSPRVQLKCQLCWSASVGNSHCRTDNKQKKKQFIQFN